MSFFDTPAKNQYQQLVYGSWGEFKTRAGRVDFLETKARLSNPPDTSPESRLTQFLRPVREALPVAEMNFNQLLQRDLDDHRVAIELVPYLLNPDRTGPAFFPPVVACLLPFENRAPKPTFPSPVAGAPVSDFAAWSTIEYGAAFRVDRLLASPEASEFHQSKLGRINWNPESTELVIIDGQHRAMALLAIDRTVNHRWTGAAEKYKSFYEPVVKRCLAGMSESEKKSVFEAVELPVTIIWFPELPSQSDHHKAARKVFVDLNKNARPPSPSRLMLLSDTDLVGIFMRALLNDMRSEGSGYPIFAVEYDNPSRDQASNAKWSTLTNVASLSESVRRLICGPERFFTDMSSMFIGRDNETLMRITLKASLNLNDALPETFEDDRLYSRDEIDITNFPPSKVPALTDQFKNGWGYLLKVFFSEFRPFKAHAQALHQLRDGWNPNGEPAASLAKDAMFEGVGLYWTLRESDAHWRADNQRLRDASKPTLPRTDVINAWDGTQLKRNEFIGLRAQAFLRGGPSKIEASEQAFSIFATAACQIGFVLAARTVASANGIEFSKIKEFSDCVVAALNEGLKGRESFVARGNQKSINMLPKLDTPFSAYFRYFWLELINTTEAKRILGDAGFSANLDDLCAIGRRHYRDFLIKLAVRAKRSADSSLPESQAHAQATAETDRNLKRLMRSIFGIDANSYDRWLQDMTTGRPSSSDEDLTDSREHEEAGHFVNGNGDSIEATSEDAEIDDLERLVNTPVSDPSPTEPED
ncbi:TPA: hypothetical protein QDB44_001719 [Burkholderia vietnamiensis]|nr:hypothetical protein [Burkholderia vietnamiensis]